MTDQTIDPAAITLPPTYSINITAYLLARENGADSSTRPELTGTDLPTREPSVRVRAKY